MGNSTDFYASIRHELEQIQAAGLLKGERPITSPCMFRSDQLGRV
jgi:hypothetical protein